MPQFDAASLGFRSLAALIRELLRRISDSPVIAVFPIKNKSCLLAAIDAIVAFTADFSGIRVGAMRMNGVEWCYTIQLN